MDLVQLKFLLNKYQLTPNKLRGQNFLIDEGVLQEIVAAAALNQEDTVVEVGPGLGALTSELVKRAKQIISFEVDNNFRPILDNLAAVNGNLKIFWQDILSLTDAQWQQLRLDYQINSYKVVANIPYYLTGKIIPQFINAQFPPQMMVLLLQREVAERIAKKNNKQSLLSLAVDFYGQAEIINLVPAASFYPEPEVESAIVRIKNIKPWSYKAEEKRVWQLIHLGFASKRKKLLNNLAALPDIDKAKLKEVFQQLSLDLNIRAEDMTTKNWLDLAGIL